MQTRHLKTLVKISHVGSFATAASQLDMTLSSVSMQMKTLEEELDVSLFDRTYRPPKLTPMGREVAEKAENVLAAERTLMASSKSDDGLSGQFRIGFVPTASVRLLPLFLKNAAQKVPDAQFEVETALSEILEEKILSGQLDAAVVTASDHVQKGLQYDVLRQETLYFAIPAKFKNKTPAELINELSFLHFNPSSGIGKLIADHINTLANNKPVKAIVLDSVEAIMQCVNEGIGFTILAEPDIKRYGVKTVKLVELSSDKISRSLVLATIAHTEEKLKFSHKLAALFVDN